MVLSTTKNWYVLRVASNKEEQVRAALERKVKIEGLEDIVGRVLVPTEKVKRIRGKRQRIAERKLYPGYVFVEMELADETMAMVKNCPGIGDFLGTNGMAVPLSAKEVEKVTAEAESKEDTPTLKIDFEPGDNVKITEGAFKNFDGVVGEVLGDKGLVRVIVTIFGRPTPVELEYWQVEKA